MSLFDYVLMQILMSVQQVLKYVMLMLPALTLMEVSSACVQLGTLEMGLPAQVFLM